MGTRCRFGMQKVAFLGLLLAACAAPPTSQPPSTPPSNGDAPPLTTTTPPEIATTPPAPSSVPPVEDAPAGIDVASATGWTMFHGDGKRTGMSSAPELKKPRVVWKAKVGIQSWLNSPIALGKTAVVVPSSGTQHNKPDAGDGVMALDLATGKRAWFTHFAQDANGVAANDAHVFATSDDENLYALAIKTGKVAWKAKGEGKMYSHPLVVGDLVVVGDASGWVRGIAAKDGAERWKVQLTGAIRGGASSDGKNVYVASEGGDVAALTTAGKTVWKQAVTRPPFGGKGAAEAIVAYSPPIVAKDVLIIPFVRDTYYTGEPGLLALDVKNGRVKWRGKGSDDWGNLRLTPVLSAGMLVYAEPYSGDIVGVNAQNGVVKYRKEVGPCLFPSWSSPAGAGNLVYVPRFDGSVYAVSPANGNVVWSVYLGDSKRAGSAGAGKGPGTPTNGGCSWDPATGKPTYSPAAVAEDGTLLLGNEEGFLYALRD